MSGVGNHQHSPIDVVVQYEPHPARLLSLLQSALQRTDHHTHPDDVHASTPLPSIDVHGAGTVNMSNAWSRLVYDCTAVVMLSRVPALPVA